MSSDLERAQALSTRLVSARTEQRRADHTLACLLVELSQDQLFRPLGYVSLEDYASSVLDLTTRQARDLLRIGRALPGLPRLSAALAAGELDWTKARELVRVVTLDTEEDWIARAKEVPSRVLEHQVGSVRRGDLPPDASCPEVARADALQTFVARMEASDLDTLRAALAALRARSSASSEELDDGALLGALARHALATLEVEVDVDVEHPSDAAPGETSDDTGDGRESRAGIQAAAATSAGHPAAPPRAVAPSGERYRVVLQVCPSCQDCHLPNPGAADADLSETVRAEAACDAEIVDMRPGPTQGHVTRTVPPATRRRVLARAKWRCEVPYCRNRLWVDVHHTHQRSDGGDHDDDRLVCLCDAHHRAVHAGHLGVERTPRGAVAVFRADGSVHVGPTHAGPTHGGPHAGPTHVGRMHREGARAG